MDPLSYAKVEDIELNESIEIVTEEELQEISRDDLKNARVCHEENNKLENLHYTEKMIAIENVLNSEPIDLEKLRQLAIDERGLVKDELRKQAWPLLMHLEKKIEFSPIPSYEEVQSHKDYNQVVLDVNRTLKRFPPGIDEEYRYVLMNQLTTLIIRVLEKYPHLHYYQGYHDVAITFLLVTGESVGFQLVEKLSLTHLAEFMRPTMEKTTYYLTYLYPVLKRANFTLYEYLVKSRVGTIFCLPWLITWYAHTLSDYRNVVRLYDFFLATPYLMPMYIAVAIVLYKEKNILEEECDMAMQHFVLSQVPDTLPFEEILKKASELYSLYPPDDLHEEVEEIIIKSQLEAEEEKKLNEARKRISLEPYKNGSSLRIFLSSIRGRVYMSPWQKTLFKVAALAITATVATGFYGYYTNSKYLEQYSQYFR